MTLPAPLKGLQVVEFTHVVMGPAVGHVLASLGAEVVRVEPIGGDPTRYLLGSGAGHFPMYNRHKKSICLDLKSDGGMEVARKLCGRADIVVENFRPGALDQLGLSYEALSVRNPGLIYCSEKGILPGPYEHRTALDEVAQMMGGLAYMTGPPNQPLRAGASVTDIGGALFGVIGILSALIERNQSGKGKKIVSSLFETVVYFVGQHMAQCVVTGQPPAPMPTRLSAWAVYDVFETRDDPVFIGVVTDALWQRFCAIFSLEELWMDQNLSSNAARTQARDQIIPIIRHAIAQFSLAEIVGMLENSGIPFAPIGKPEDLFVDPHLLASGGLEPVVLDNGVNTRLPTLPICLDGQRLTKPDRLTAPGENTRELMAMLGYDEEATEGLLKGGQIG